MRLEPTVRIVGAPAKRWPREDWSACDQLVSLVPSEPVGLRPYLPLGIGVQYPLRNKATKKCAWNLLFLFWARRRSSGPVKRWPCLARCDVAVLSSSWPVCVGGSRSKGAEQDDQRTSWNSRSAWKAWRQVAHAGGLLHPARGQHAAAPPTTSHGQHAASTSSARAEHASGDG